MISELLRDKYQLEAEMRADPNEHTLRARYFDILNTICCSHFGSFCGAARNNNSSAVSGRQF